MIWFPILATAAAVAWAAPSRWDEIRPDNSVDTVPRSCRVTVAVIVIVSVWTAYGVMQ